ncbi:hypothetical protein [Boudabousia liubingyangii]|uniref:hypothetical protein n=1 Tax=Boudabousia liubingyangii TaxID=1921764 RepID=UPI0009F8C9ED|nr:hypothetical protein [Boudabousia liubingyangii]
MGKKLRFITGALLGYVLGARAGRGRYEQIKRAANNFSKNPMVAKPFNALSNQVSQTVKNTGQVLTDKAAEALKNQLFGGNQNQSNQNHNANYNANGANPTELNLPNENH